MGLPHTRVCMFEKHENLPGSLDWTQRTKLLALAFAGYHSAIFLFVWVRQGQSVCYPCAWPSTVTRQHPWCDCLSNPGHVRRNTSRNGYRLDIIRATNESQVELTQTTWARLSYTTNCLHSAFSFFYSDWLNRGRFERDALYIWLKQTAHFFQKLYGIHLMTWAEVTSELITKPHYILVSSWWKLTEADVSLTNSRTSRCGPSKKCNFCKKMGH
jgi:hypothetical protein